MDARRRESVTDFIVKMLEPYGKLPGAALCDPYCIGFLEIVGLHVAAKSLGIEGEHHGTIDAPSPHADPVTITPSVVTV
jgi:hypothetical protein